VSSKSLASRALVLARLVVVVVVVVWTTARPALADDEDPRPRNALSACAAGDVKGGVAILAELYAQTRDPSFVFNQGRCYQQNGQLEPARPRFAEYLRVGTKEPPEDLERAKGFIKEIDEALAEQRAHPVPPPAAVVTTPPAAAASPAPEGRARTYRITGMALAALGLAAAGTGVYMTIQVRSLENDVEQRFSTMNSVVTDPAALQRQLSDGGRYETWQWISYGISIAALAGAATTLALGGTFSSAERSTLAVAPTVSSGGAGGVLHFRF
jgi:hypothetical protein